MPRIAGAWGKTEVIKLDVAEYRRDAYTISTDKQKLDVELIYDYLSHTSYWAQGRSRAAVQKSIKHSLCFGVFEGARQVGFARVVTDYATFGWLCDVFILVPHRGRNLGKWLIECITAHPELQGVGLFMLATRDAHELYRRYGGFQNIQEPDRWMLRRASGVTSPSSINAQRR
jgi:hypothetical protein